MKTFSSDGIRIILTNFLRLWLTEINTSEMIPSIFIEHRQVENELMGDVPNFACRAQDHRRSIITLRTKAENRFK